MDPATANGAPPAPSKAAADGKAPESADYANYFCTYSYLYHQVRERG